jgi:hypothetical protein
VVLTQAIRELSTAGATVVPAATLKERIGASASALRRFAEHWDDLGPDPYAAALGTQRLRRYGHFTYRSAGVEFRRMPHETFVQPDDSNPLYVGTGRQFLPLTDAFAEDPVLHAVLVVLARLATTLDRADEWSVKVTPFRVVATADSVGQPTPEGLHRDGVTLVTSLLIDRSNARGGQSTVVDQSGGPLLTTILAEPGTLLASDDRRTKHAVSPMGPVNPARPARRDVLVVTFAARPG